MRKMNEAGDQQKERNGIVQREERKQESQARQRDGHTAAKAARQCERAAKIQVDFFLSIMTFHVSLKALSASIFNLLKGVKIALECRPLEPEAHCRKFLEAPKKLPRMAATRTLKFEWQVERNSGRGRSFHDPNFPFPTYFATHSVSERELCLKSLNFSIIPLKRTLRSVLAKL